jgi:hypothetical protein
VGQKTEFLKRSIPSDPHLWIAFTAAIIFLLLDILHVLKWSPLEVPPEGLLILIVFCIVALVADRLKEVEKAREDSEKLGRITNSLSDKKVVLRNRPSSAEDYAYLWGGYTDVYRVYNPSYRVDNVNDKDEIVKILIHRYQNPRFEKAQYVFFTKDDSGRNALETFREMMTRVQGNCPDAIRKIEVKEWKDKKASLAPEIYLGNRDGRPMCVLELKEPFSDLQHGMPHYYLVVQDKAVIDHYRENYFDSAWEAATKIDILKK